MAEGNLRLIIDDFKTSWYFRVWVLLWVVCAIISFVALGILSHSSSENQLKPGWRIWIDEPGQLNYPDFYFSLLPGENISVSISSQNCYNQNHSISIPITGCDGAVGLSECFVMQSSSIVSKYTEAARTFPFWAGSHIFCDINITVENPTADDTMLAVGVYNTDRIFPKFIFPGTVAEIRIEEEVIQPKGQSGMVRHRLEQNYESDRNSHAAFTVFFRFAHWRVMHFEETNLFNGWMGVGEIGGFVFFLYLLHTITMAIIGICLPNTSKFLGGNTEGYARV